MTHRSTKPGVPLAIALARRTRCVAGAVALLAVGTLPALAHAAQARGIDLSLLDRSVRPQDDLYEFAVGGWLAATTIPEDRSQWGAFSELEERTEAQLKGLVDEIAKYDGPRDSTQGRLREFLRSYMAEEALERLDLEPVRKHSAVLRDLHSKEELPRLFAALQRDGVTVPLRIDVAIDPKDSTRYVARWTQSGLGLPNREYYLSSDASLAAVRREYRAYVEHLLEMAGWPHPGASADRVLRIETELARAQWSIADSQDPVRTYNAFSERDLGGREHEGPWLSRFMRAARVRPTAEHLVLQPSYAWAVVRLSREQSVQAWRDYLMTRIIDWSAPLLSKRFAAAHFDLHEKIVKGTKRPPERWKLALLAVDDTLGYAVGDLYVARYFPPEAKRRMQALVQCLRQAFDQSIGELTWMSSATKEAAKKKLASYSVKVGYPDVPRSFAGLDVDRGDLLGNVVRARRFEYDRRMARIGKEVDRVEWEMTPQTVNAYFKRALNELVFPAALLQPPFFDPAADDATNFGAIGMFIAHEITHGFDQSGSHFDDRGNMRDWWTEDDRTRLRALGERLVEYYSRFEPLPGRHLDGRLTLNENIADVSGLQIAFRAYLISQNGRQPEIIDGFSGAQRFFLAFAQAFRSKQREASALQRLITDVHAPDRFRVLGAASHTGAFYDAFGFKENDRMFLPPDERVRIW